jgi:hypothetical protein
MGIEPTTSSLRINPRLFFVFEAFQIGITLRQKAIFINVMGALLVSSGFEVFRLQVARFVPQKTDNNLRFEPLRSSISSPDEPNGARQPMPREVTKCSLTLNCAHF